MTKAGITDLYTSALKGVLVIGTLLLTAATKEKVPTQWVPLKCMTRMVITDFGVCKQDGTHYVCPHAHLEFNGDCVSVGEAPGPEQGRVSITRPTAVKIEKQIGGYIQ